MGARSPFMLDLLVNARLVATTHYPVLVLRGVSSQDMKLILQFVYNGKGNLVFYNYNDIDLIILIRFLMSTCN